MAYSVARRAKAEQARRSPTSELLTDSESLAMSTSAQTRGTLVQPIAHYRADSPRTEGSPVSS